MALKEPKSYDQLVNDVFKAAPYTKAQAQAILNILNRYETPSEIQYSIMLQALQMKADKAIKALVKAAKEKGG